MCVPPYDKTEYVFDDVSTGCSGDSLRVEALLLLRRMLWLVPAVRVGFAPSASVSVPRSAVRRVPPPALSEFLPLNAGAITPLFDHCLVDLQVAV